VELDLLSFARGPRIHFEAETWNDVSFAGHATGIY
jgi:hypothetical protein